MTIDELKAWALAEAERVARPHWALTDQWNDCPQNFYPGDKQQDLQCICGRDAEVRAIAAAIEAAYIRGAGHDYA